MSTWLAVLEVGIILAAAVGTVLLRRHGDRQWADHLARQRLMATPVYKEIAGNFVRLQITIRDSLTPALMKAAASLTEFSKALDALPRPTWRQRIALRIRGWFA